MEKCCFLQDVTFSFVYLFRSLVFFLVRQIPVLAVKVNYLKNNKADPDTEHVTILMWNTRDCKRSSCHLVSRSSSLVTGVSWRFIFRSEVIGPFTSNLGHNTKLCCCTLTWSGFIQNQSCVNCKTCIGVPWSTLMVVFLCLSAIEMMFSVYEDRMTCYLWQFSSHRWIACFCFRNGSNDVLFMDYKLFIFKMFYQCTTKSVHFIKCFFYYCIMMYLSWMLQK